MWLQYNRGRPTRIADIAPRRLGRCWVGFAGIALLLGVSPASEAASRNSRAQKPSARSGNGSKSSSRATSDSVSLADAKIAVLAFEGDDAEPLRKHVIKVFVDRGMKVNSTLKAQDNAIQYRDMGAALDLAVYVHGKIRDTGPEKAVATVTIRSAVTGRPVTTASFNGYRRGLPFDVEEKLWDRVAPALKRACREAQRPGRRHSKPLHINAGTPL
jgi:hypothetical protein